MRMWCEVSKGGVVASFPCPAQIFIACSMEKRRSISSCSREEIYQAFSRFSILRVTKSWVGAGNEARGVVLLCACVHDKYTCNDNTDTCTHNTCTCT